MAIRNHTGVTSYVIARMGEMRLHVLCISVEHFTYQKWSSMITIDSKGQPDAMPDLVLLDHDEN